MPAASCGGGGSSQSAPIPVNYSPSFTSGTSATAPENSAGTIYSAAATDPDGDPVQFAISGGADAAAFKLDGAALSFVSPPNFDQPTDANTDNAYEVTLKASDGKGGAALLPIVVTVTNDHEGVNLTRVAGGFGADAVIAPFTRGSGLIVVSQNGVVQLVDATTGALSSDGNVFKSGETGRVLAVAHFNTYGVAMLDIDGRGVIARTIPVPGSLSSNVLDATLAPASTMKPRGTLFIGGDGFLFGALGDPSGDFAQDKASGFGKFYRIQVDPYCGASVPSLCIYAELFGDGVHAPPGGGGYHGFSFLLDRGTDQQEEVDYFNQDAQPLDFGWPYREGTYQRVANPPPAVNGPSLTYDHGDGFFAGKGLTGGTYYPGPIASLAGRILLTDESGKIFDFPASFLADGILHKNSEMENRSADFAPVSGAIDQPIAIVLDSGGRLFVLNANGDLYGTT